MIGSPKRGRAGSREPGLTPSFRARSPRHRPRGSSFLRRYWWAFVLVPSAFVILFVGALAWVYVRTPLTRPPAGDQTTYLYDRSGKLIATLHSDVNRTVVPSSEIPKSMKEAVVALEDRNFYHEGGISPFSIVRAAWADLTHRQFVQGGSTITQQYVKNVYTGNERTFARKVKEAVLAVKLARTMSKDEILSAYLNTVYFGGGAYGVQAAAQTYWGIPARKLSILQSATLAGLVQAPSYYDPVQNPQGAKYRRNLALAAMAREGSITQDQAATLEQRPLKVNRPRAQTFPHPYFVSYVSQLLRQQYGYQQTFKGGLRVTTTLDLRTQQAAEQAVAAHLSGSGNLPSAALVAIDPATGDIRAMVGGLDFSRQQLNLATQAARQAGSSFKPFTLAAALSQRISPYSVFNGPPQITINDPRCFTNGAPWQVANYADESAGTMNLFQATAHSVNTIFAQLVTKVGPQDVVDVAHGMGIRSPLDPVCSITLGTQLVNPLEMTNAYATLAARGVRRAPRTFLDVKSPDGQDLARPGVRGRRALDQNVADTVTYALEGVIQNGTGTAANIGRPAAGKTGTAENYQDAWFCGYTPQLAACVWVGYPQGEIPMHGIDGFYDVVGGSVPAAIWHDFMASALANTPVANFAMPNLNAFSQAPPPYSPAPTSPSPSPSPSPPPSPGPSPTLPPTTPPPSSGPPGPPPTLLPTPSP